MIKRMQWLILVAVVVVVVGLVVGAEKLGHVQHASCDRGVQADEAKVRTDHAKEFANNVPGLGDYLEIHWQYDALNDPCARNANPMQRQYFAVVRLRPADADTMHTQFTWQPMDPAQVQIGGVRPALAPFMPAGATWLSSQAYTSTYLRNGASGNLYLDPADDLVYVMVLDVG